MYPLRSLQTLGVAALAATASAAALPSTLQARACTTQDQPNPIAATYPDKTTGVFNATVAILPIPFDTARAIIPAQYAILDHLFADYFKSAGYSSFPQGSYPLLVEAGTLHDIQSPTGATPDYAQLALSFPFVDRLGDNSTSFRYAPAPVTSDSSTFSPDCAAYAKVPNTLGQVATALNVSGDAAAQLAFHQTSQTTIPYNVFRNISNQPSFSGDDSCDVTVRLFTPTVFYNAAQFMPRAVAGSVVLDNVAPLTGEQSFGVGNSGVHGFQLATPFFASEGVECASLSGYTVPKVSGL